MKPGAQALQSERLLTAQERKDLQTALQACRILQRNN